MKQKRLKNYLKIGILLFGISFLLVSCQKEEEIPVNLIVKDRLISYKIIEFNQFANSNTDNLRLLELSIDKINSVRNSINRTTEDNSFVIDTSVVATIEHTSGYSSQTFIIDTEPNSTILENLLISTKTDGTQQALLIEYTLDTAIKNIDNSTFAEHVIETKIHDLENYTISYASRSTTFCYEETFVNHFQCDEGELVTPSSHPECFDSNG